MFKNRSHLVRYAAGGIAIFALPFVFGPILGTQIVVFAIFALGYNLLLGYGGEMSFGHAAYFGLGAYGTILTAQQVPNLFVALGAGILLGTIAGAILGALSLKRRGIYFSMITLAFAQMLYLVFLQATGVTGGSNGLSFPAVDAPGPLSPGGATLGFFLFVVAVLAVVFVMVKRIVNSPYGRILVAIRENPQRARALGYNINRYLLIAFVMSSFFSAIAGALYAMLFSFVTPDVLFWATSGDIVMMTIIGGVGTLGGQIIGPVVFLTLSNYLTEFFDVWEILFGALIVFVVLGAPQGLYGLFREYFLDERTSFDARESLRRLIERR